MKNEVIAKLKKMTAALILLFLGLGIGLFVGQYSKPIDENEVQEISESNKYQYLTKETSLEDALASGHYSHCVVFPGVGLEFSEQKINGDLVVKQSVRSYPAYEAELLAGARVKTPLDIIKGDYGSPVKITFINYLKEKEVILNRVLIKKCLKKRQKEDRQFKDSY